MCNESKFEFNDIVKCKFRGKEVLGFVVSKKGFYTHWNEPQIHREPKYLIKIRESDKSQMKWESELIHVKSFARVNDAYKYLGIKAFGMK